MKTKTIYLILLLCLSSFLTTACVEKKNVENNNPEEITPKYQSIEWNCDVPIKEIKTIKENGMMDIQPKMFITKDGKLYLFSVDKKYSNEQICKEVETTNKVNRFNMYPNDRDLSLIVDEKDNFYYYEDSLINFSERDEYHYKATTNFILKYPMSYTTYTFEYRADAGSVFINYYVENNSIYSVKSYWKDSKTHYEEPILIKQFTDENIIALEGKIFKTDKAYYKIGTTNKEECEQYEDIECESGLVKIEEISKDYNNIEYFNGNYIIYKNDPKIYIYTLYSF